MGILEVTDAAWDSADYTYTWEGMIIPEEHFSFSSK